MGRLLMKLPTSKYNGGLEEYLFGFDIETKLGYGVFMVWYILCIMIHATRCEHMSSIMCAVYCSLAYQMRRWKPALEQNTGNTYFI